MAYQIPQQWAHGEAVSAAKMNKYGDALNAVYATSGASNLNWAIQRNGIWLFVHRFRWLHYSRDGVIMDINGSEDSFVNISGDVEEFDVYDLDSVPWLQYGMMYRVNDCYMACESNET